jgi:Fic family protein
MARDDDEMPSGAERRTATASDRGEQSGGDDIIQRIQGEYLEMPGLRLTAEQAKRFLGLDEETAGQVLEKLVDERFLSRTADGAYVRGSEGSERDEES